MLNYGKDTALWPSKNKSLNVKVIFWKVWSTEPLQLISMGAQHFEKYSYQLKKYRFRLQTSACYFWKNVLNYNRKYVYIKFGRDMLPCTVMKQGWDIHGVDLPSPPSPLACCGILAPCPEATGSSHWTVCRECYIGSDGSSPPRKQ